jgi:peptidoglycan hydrolase CwlO-like protein
MATQKIIQFQKEVTEANNKIKYLEERIGKLSMKRSDTLRVLQVIEAPR